MELNEKQTLQKQANVKKLLADTFPIDYPNSFAGQCILRFYRMTASEYASSRDYTLTVIFGDKPSSKNKCEGFCYDIRQLLTEKYITLDGRTAHVPILLSPERWNWLCSHVSHDKLALYSREPGKLEYPLLHQELMVILKNIRYQPTICSTMDGCVPIDLTSTDVKTAKLFDLSPDKRFGPEPTKEPSKPFVFSEGLEQQNKQDESARVKRVLDLTSQELKDIDIFVTKVQEVLFSEKNQDYIKKMLASGANEEQVSGFLIEDTLKTILGKTD
jgi:hypothetical protein